MQPVSSVEKKLMTAAQSMHCVVAMIMEGKRCSEIVALNDLYAEVFSGQLWLTGSERELALQLIDARITRVRRGEPP
jgi:hypothetical protein